MKKTEKIQDFKDTFLRIINKFKALEKVPVDHGTGEPLYASEVNTLEVIGECPGINLTQLAYKRGVTKGAVSQIVAKLVKKQLVVKTQTPDNDKVIHLRLTALGKVAFVNHEKFHAQYDTPMIEKLSVMSDEQLDLVADVFATLESTLDGYLRDLK